MRAIACQLIISALLFSIPHTGGAADSSDTVDPSTLTGKVMCGYQGWFTCEGDGMNLGWVHWSKNRQKPFGPGNVTVDLWPDVSEFDEDEVYETGFTLPDGSPAKVFSSANRKTVLRHFSWMEEYGIDGVFLQRFANGLKSPELLNQKNTVLKHAREGAEQSGRTFSIMYDLSGLKAGDTSQVKEDWGKIKDAVTDASYQKHEEKPVVAIWGIGFNDDRKYTLKECHDLVSFFKNDGCSVMLGVPAFWREGIRDATDDPLLHEIIALADIVSPWSIGRYQTPKQAHKHGEKVYQPDLVWCREKALDYLPVVFPGFSWHNLHGGEMDSIPRLGGEFLWAQLVAAKSAGCEMIYVAMFDEVDEGTAIFKCTNQVPVGDGVSFLDYKGLPSDHYLRLTGLGGKMLRGEIPMSAAIPKP